MPKGLIQRAQQQAPTSDAPVESEESNLTPEEQESYEAAMKMVGEIIYNNDESHDAILELMSEEDPISGTAEAAMFLLSQIEETFQGQYPEELILATVDEITDLLLELADTAKLFEVDEQVATDIKSASAQALVDEYGADAENVQAHLGDVTQTDADEMQQLFGGRNA